MSLSDEGREIVSAAYQVRSVLGPGLLENVYEVCLAHELTVRGLEVRTQVALPIVYRDVRLDAGYRIDLIVAGKFIVEAKAVARLLPIHEAQLLSYLRLGGYPVGFLINFHERHLKDGLHRYVI